MKRTLRISANGFTLPEIVISMTILAILATISFVSYNSYLVESRDSKRIVDVEAISSGLEIYYKKNGGVYPKPSDSVVLSYTGSDGLVKPFSYLGFIKDSIRLDFNSVPRDPLTNDHYVYGATIDLKFYEIGASLEESPAAKTAYVPLVDTAYAASDDGYAYVVGNYRMDALKGRFFKGLIVMSQGGDGKYSIPRTDFNVGTQDALTKEVVVGSGAAFIEYGSTIAPYPVKGGETSKSVSESASTSSFEIEGSTGVVLQCRNCQP